MRYENGGLKNQLAPRNNSRKMNKALLIINAVLCVCALVIGIFHLYYEEPTIALAMLLVMLITAINVWEAFKRLKRKAQ